MSPTCHTAERDGNSSLGGLGCSAPTSSPASLLVATRKSSSCVKRKSKREEQQNIQRPLTQIAKGVPDLPIVDIASFVNRSEEERHLETARNGEPGHIKRPMNSFMLYRKAYLEVAKTQCTGNNHQLVSKVCGYGWSFESTEVKEKFKKWATIEKTNHQRAHPGYKFTPSKGRKRKRDNVDDDVPDIDYSNWGSRPRRPIAKDATTISKTPSHSYDPAPETMGNQFIGSAIQPTMDSGYFFPYTLGSNFVIFGNYQDPFPTEDVRWPSYFPA